MGNDRKEENLTEYEKQRLLRIKENQARLEALGLPGLASSVRGDLSKQPEAKSKSKKKKKKTEPDEEEEYRPSDEDDDDDEEEDEDEDKAESMENSSSEEEMPSSSTSRRRKGKSTISFNDRKPSKGSRLKKGRKVGDFVDDDDIALAQAIAMSLEEPVEDKNGGAEVQNKAVRKRKSTTKHEKLNKKPSKSRIQLSEDEVIGFFFSFDEVGKGYITAYDIEKMAIAHDFIWADGEIAKMVRCFDSDGDRKLTLEDFRSIVSKCHMLQES